MLASLFGAGLKALLGAFVTAFNDWRRDESLKRLGYTEAQREYAMNGLAQAREANVIREAVRALPAADLDTELRGPTGA